MAEQSCQIIPFLLLLPPLRLLPLLLSALKILLKLHFVKVWTAAAENETQGWSSVWVYFLAEWFKSNTAEPVWSLCVDSVAAPYRHKESFIKKIQN